MRRDVDLKTVAKKKLKFAGYEFSSGPDGTVIHRETIRDIQLHVGDRVIYKDDILRRHRGILNRIDGRWAFVLWDRWPEHGAIKEWLANLCKV